MEGDGYKCLMDLMDRSQILEQARVFKRKQSCKVNLLLICDQVLIKSAAFTVKKPFLQEVHLEGMNMTGYTVTGK